MTEEQKPRRTRRTREQMEADARAQGAQSTPAPAATRKPRQKKRKQYDVTPEGLTTAHAVVGTAAKILARLVPSDVRPTEAEIDGMLVPLERIALRRWGMENIPILTDNGRDAAEAATEGIAYASRVAAGQGRASRQYGQPTVNAPRGTAPDHSGRARPDVMASGANGSHGESTIPTPESIMADLHAATFVPEPGEG